MHNRACSLLSLNFVEHTIPYNLYACMTIIKPHFCRRMFPHLEVSFQNLNPSSVYSLKLEIHPCDAKRYKFLKTEWVPTGRAEKKQTNSVYEHPDSPNTGSFWISKTISFKMVKLTNNKVPKFKDQV